MPAAALLLLAKMDACLGRRAVHVHPRMAAAANLVGRTHRPECARLVDALVARAPAHLGAFIAQLRAQGGRFDRQQLDADQQGEEEEGEEEGEEESAGEGEDDEGESGEEMSSEEFDDEGMPSWTWCDRSKASLL